jgi:shikimate dehydrogenase
MALANEVAAGDGPPLVPIAMGPLGVCTRILSARTGAPFTYASAGPGAEAAPGQIPAALLADLYRVRSITPATRAYGVLGSDVQNSLSPVLHNRAFEARNVDAVYVPLQADDLEQFMAAVPALGLAGFSVTRPFKVDILRYLHEVEETAAVSSSVNTVVVQDGMLRGSTTDGIGVLGPLRKRIDLKGRMVVILGAGGAARAAALALQRRGAQVTVLARNAAKAAAVAAAIGCEDGVLEHASSHDWDILINATPLGSRANPDETPLRAGSHRPDTIVLDMVYDPLETQFLRDAQAHGCRIVDGLEMLIAQAMAQFETWTGLEAPADVMKSAALWLAQEQER